ncbi:MAG: aspartate kinase [Pirellulaceae bacterium]|jgi:aspartokinase-like uncharacterized kinase|nr:aspartate kinase [Pirellulaceae bacterium]
MSGQSQSQLQSLLPRRVVKVGGSLLDWPPLAERLAAWLASQPPAQTLLIAGGGNLAEAIRRADQLHGLGETAAHWLCVDALSVTARMLAAILRDARIRVTDNITELAAALPGTLVFDPSPFLRAAEPILPGEPLPHDWSVTTDSIAARVAECWPADELVLLKSCDPGPWTQFANLAECDYVDRHFPTVARRLPIPIRFINLRGDGWCASSCSPSPPGRGPG